MSCRSYLSTMLLSLTCRLCALSAAVIPVAALAAETQALTATARSELIDAVAVKLAGHYVDEAAGRRIGAQLRAKLAGGAYDAIDNPAQFAEAVTRDMRAINGDLHLSLTFSPLAAGGGAPPAPHPAAAGSGGASPSQRMNFGLGRAEILDGNVGYLEIRAFDEGEGYQRAVVAALRFLEHADALIIDVRRNGGGSSEMSHLIFSHFLGARPVPTIRVASRSTAAPELRHSLADVPGPRRTDVPLYVLTSGFTASAAEEFSFVLHNQHRATLLGSRTSGAGHMVDSLPLGRGFSVGVSVTRVTDPVSGLEWEQVGVEPDRQVPVQWALTEAHIDALRRLATGSADAAYRKRLERLAAMLEARRHPHDADAALLDKVGGRYGQREVVVEGGRISVALNGGVPEELAYLGGSRFALGASEYQFDTSVEPATLTIEGALGTRVSYRRLDH